jgi:hypothetical protein
VAVRIGLHAPRQGVTQGQVVQGCAAPGGRGGGGSGGGGGGGGSPLIDTTPPLGKLSGKKTQKLGKSVSVTVTCIDEACTASATGKASRSKLKRARKTIAKGHKAKLKLKLSKKARKKLKRALRKHRKVKAKIKVSLTDAAGNKRVLRRTVRLKR